MKHFYQNIHGWSNFLPWYDEAIRLAQAGDYFVEIGVYLGKSAAYMGVEIANSGKPLSLCAVDTWTGLYEDKYLKAKKNLAPVAGQVEVFRYSSIQFAFHVRKVIRKLPFMVNIDASHDYLSVVQDIHAWWPLIKPGGFLMGDDYRQDRFPGVHQAVKDFAEREGLEIEVGFDDQQVSMNTWRVWKHEKVDVPVAAPAGGVPEGA